MAELTYLFTSKEQTIEIKAWYAHISENSKTYEDCVVRSLTHVKNLRSPVVHEYLQAAIENTKTQERTRIIAERQTTQDQVIVGRWGTSNARVRPMRGTLGSPGEDLPLPLRTLEFEEGTLKVLDFALILRNTTSIGGKYNLKANCYWFADTVYTGLITRASIQKQRVFQQWKGQLIVLTEEGELDAEVFRDGLKDNWEYAPGEPVKKWQFFEDVYREAICLEVDDEEEARKQFSELSTELINNDITQNLSFSALRKWDPKNPVEEDLNIDEVYEKVAQDGEAGGYENVNDEYSQPKLTQKSRLEISHEQRVPKELLVLKLNKSQQEKLDKAVKIMAGQLW